MSDQVIRMLCFKGHEFYVADLEMKKRDIQQHTYPCPMCRWLKQQRFCDRECTPQIADADCLKHSKVAQLELARDDREGR